MELPDLPFLEQLTLRKAASKQADLFLRIVAADGRFSSLISLSLDLGSGQSFYLRKTQRRSNKILRHLAIHGCHAPNFELLLQTFPNLMQLEANFRESLTPASDASAAHLSLSYLQVTLDNVVSDLERLLQSASNIKRLRLRGELQSDNVVEQFERIAHSFIRLAPRLVKFDCELFCYMSDRNGYESVIQQLHPLFGNVQYLLGPDENRCYVTDMEVYPNGNEFQRMYHRNHSYIRNIFHVFPGYLRRSPDFLIRTFGCYSYQDYHCDDDDNDFYFHEYDNDVDDDYFESFERSDADDRNEYDYHNFCAEHFDEDSKDYDGWRRS